MALHLAALPRRKAWVHLSEARAVGDVGPGLRRDSGRVFHPDGSAPAGAELAMTPSGSRVVPGYDGFERGETPMHTTQTRRRFLTNLSLAGAAGLLYDPRVAAAEGPSKQPL